MRPFFKHDLLVGLLRIVFVLLFIRRNNFLRACAEFVLYMSF